MISAPGNIFRCCFCPVAPELLIYNARTFGSFYKSKANFYSFIPHLFYFFPIDGTLITAYINPMNFIPVWDFYLETGIKNVWRKYQYAENIIKAGDDDKKRNKNFEKCT